jgi:hypothetical protein
MSIVGHVVIVSKYLKHVCGVTKCVDSDFEVKIKVKIINLHLTLSPPGEISRTAVD